MAKINLEQIWSDWHAEEKPLGKGSYGTVYKAVRQDNNLTSYSAVKVISIPQDPSEIDTLRSEGLDMNQSKTYLKGVVDDFVREIQLMQSFKGTQNIVSVEDYKVVPKTDEIGWDIYIRMELLTSFNEYVCDKKLSEQDVIKLGIDICTALEMCESRNIIHRDIKPDNIFINDFGYFKLGDFGIARTMANMTNGMSQKGTPFYMAPEVFVSNRYDARVDICSLGIVMYKLLNKDLLPFIESKDQLMNPNAKANALERRKLGEPMIPPCEASPAMANLILRACAHDPDDRFANASEMKAALMSVQNGTYKILSLDPDATTSVRRKSQDLNSTTSVRRKEQNFDGTTSVRHAPQNYTDNAPNTFGTKKKSKAPAIIAAILAVVLLAGGGFIAYPHIANMLNIEQTGDVGESDDKQNDTAKYSKKDNEQIASIISEAEAVVNDDIEGAIAKIQTGLVTYPKSADLQDKLDEYTERLSAQIKADTLDKAAKLADSGDYVAAMAMIETARKDSPDDADYKSAYDNYAAAHKSNLVSEALESADTLSANGDYLGALQTVNQALKAVGDDNSLTAAAKTYEDAYAKSVSAQVDAYLAEQNITAAKQLLDTASKEIPNNAVIKAEKDEVDKYKTVSLSTLNPINGNIKWNEGTPLDSFGNTYNDVDNYVIIVPGYNNRGIVNYVEYKLDKKYTEFSFMFSPYTSISEDASAYIQIYVNDVLRYTTDVITRKSDPFRVNVDVSDATTLKIVIRMTSYADIMLSDVILTNTPDFKSSINTNYTSLSTLTPINGSMTWDNDYPRDSLNNTYNSAVNYSVIIPGYNNRGIVNYAEYRLDKKYTEFSFMFSPYTSISEDASAYIQIYVNDVLRYTTDVITRKSDPFRVNVDVSDATTLKIVIRMTSYADIMLSDVILTNTPDFKSSINTNYTSLSTLTPINGSMTWDNDYPRDSLNNTYNSAVNYSVIIPGYNNRGIVNYAEYYINSNYSSLEFQIAPYTSIEKDATAQVIVYVDDVIRYTSPQISRTTNCFSTGKIDLKGAKYIKIQITHTSYSNIMIFDAKLY